MELERIESPGLAHYSYILADADAGLMAVVDPQRDIDAYLEYATNRKLRVAHVLETHIHADYCSGARELAAATGAPLHVSRYDEGETFTVTFPHVDLEEGDQVAFGSVSLRVLHTPGHTPEHLSFLVFDHAITDVPVSMLSGDFLFVGSLGRPDLLGDEQKRALAHRMFRSVRDKLSGLGDGVTIYPAHGAGSMCGSGMSGRAESTIGLERATNPYLDPRLGEEEFVARLLADVPPFPPYYRRMKRLNAAGPALRRTGAGIRPQDCEQVEALIARGAAVIDLRDQIAFGRGHLPGSFGIGLAHQLPVWAAWMVPYDVPIVLVCDMPRDALAGATLLARVGLDDVRGFLEGGIEAWSSSGRELELLPQESPRELASELEAGGEVAVIDVRSDGEWRAGHIREALHAFGGTIGDNLSRLPAKDRRIVVTCGGGYRSTVVASVLKRQGFGNVSNLTGGMRAWMQAGLPVGTDRGALSGRNSL